MQLGVFGACVLLSLHVCAGVEGCSGNLYSLSFLMRSMLSFPHPQMVTVVEGVCLCARVLCACVCVG